MTSRELVAVVLTALPVEMAAVLARLGENRSVALAGPVVCEVGPFAASSGRLWRVVAAELGPGTVDTAGAVVALAARFGPDVLMFAGIAGALTGDVAVGDVVAGTEVAWTERGKWSAGAYQARIRTVSLSAVLTQLARKIAREGSWTGGSRGRGRGRRRWWPRSPAARRSLLTMSTGPGCGRPSLMPLRLRMRVSREP